MTKRCSEAKGSGGWTRLFLFICFLRGPSSSQLSAWLSGGGSLPQYIWSLRLLFGYESWILFSFPLGDAGCQLPWLQSILAHRDTFWENFDRRDLFLLSVVHSFSNTFLVWPVSSREETLLLSFRWWGSRTSARLTRQYFSSFLFYIF